MFLSWLLVYLVTRLRTHISIRTHLRRQLRPSFTNTGSSPANGRLGFPGRWPCLEDIVTDRSINVINHVQTLQASGEESCHTRFLTFDIFTAQLFDKTHYPPTACSLSCAADSQINPSTVSMKRMDMTRNSHLGNDNDSSK